jgi:outer membrane protein TolC
MGLPVETQFHVEALSELPIPTQAADSLSDEIKRGLRQRPQLLADIARIHSAEGLLKQAKSTYFPTLHLGADAGSNHGYGQQDLYPGHHGDGEVWSAALELKWTLFDGAAREKRVAAAHAERAAAEAELQARRDQVEQEVFTSYTNMQTALSQQRAAADLLVASSQSYDAARRSYSLGLRSQLDVISAQKGLAQARYADVAARSQLLLQIADLAFRTADTVRLQPTRPTAKP